MASTTAAVENATEDIPKTAALRRSSSGTSEEVREVEVLRTLSTHVRGSKPAGKAGASVPSEATAIAQHGLELVVFFAFGGIGKHIVCFRNPLEPVRCRGVIGVGIGVVFAGKLAVRALDLALVCGRGDPQIRIIIFVCPFGFSAHWASPPFKKNRL